MSSFAELPLTGPIFEHLLKGKTSALFRWLKPLLIAPGHATIDDTFTAAELSLPASTLATLLADRVFEPLYQTRQLYTHDSAPSHPHIVAIITSTSTSTFLYHSSLASPPIPSSPILSAFIYISPIPSSTPLPPSTAYTSPPSTQTPQLVTLFADKPLMGQDKWLGGVNSPSGLSCYGVPGGAMRTLKIDTTTTPNTLTEIGPHFPGKFKWLRGVTVASEFTNSDFPEGMCICLPSNASSVLLINPATDEVTTFGGPFTHR